MTQRIARRAIEELLADGEWWDYEEIVFRVVPKLPPTYAIRVAERRRFRRRPTVARKPELNEDSVLVGGRWIVCQALRSLTVDLRTPVLQRDGNRYRLIEETYEQATQGGPTP